MVPDKIKNELLSLAQEMNVDTGRWVYGRRKLMQMYPDLSEWAIRRVLSEVRGEGSGAAPAPTPEKLNKKEREKKVLSLPKIVVNMPKRPTRKTPSKKKSVERIVIGSDFHAPYEDEAACEVFYQIVEDSDADRVILLGDVMTLDPFSRFDTNPMGPTWIEDVANAGRILGSVTQAVREDCVLEWFMGNHEDRLRRYLMRHDPLLYGHLNVPKLFMLSEDDRMIGLMDRWDYMAENEVFDEELSLIIKHGTYVRKHSGNSVRAEIENLLLSVVMGHSHRLAIYRKHSGRSRYLGESCIFGIETGMLGRYDQPWLEGKTEDWQQGFAILTVDRSFETPIIEPTVIEISHGKALYRDHLYSA